MSTPKKPVAAIVSRRLTYAIAFAYAVCAIFQVPILDIGWLGMAKAVASLAQRVPIPLVIIIIAILLGVFVLFGAAISEEVIHKELMKDEPEEEKKRERRPGKTGSIMTTSPMRRSRVRRLR